MFLSFSITTSTTTTYNKQTHFQPTKNYHLVNIRIVVHYTIHQPPATTLMNPQNHHHSQPDSPVHNLPPVQVKPPPSPRVPLTNPTISTPTATATPTSIARRRIAVAVDLSDESAYAVKWAVQNYLRPGDAVILLHVRSTSVLYGADWGATATTDNPATPTQQKKLEEDFDKLTTTKITHLAQPLVDAHVPFKIHIVKDHDMKERLCLEVERLGLSTVITGSRGLGASRMGSRGMLGSVSDYCVQHCVCPVVVVRDPALKNGGGSGGGATAAKKVEDAVESSAGGGGSVS